MSGFSGSFFDCLGDFALAGGHERVVNGVSVFEPRVMAVYAARGNPTIWQDWTRPNHRRVVKPGVWICAKPTPPPEGLSEVERRVHAAQSYRHSRTKIGLLLGSGRTAHFFKDDSNTDDMPEPEEVPTLSDYCCFNTHLGKAGGLNFGLHTVAMLLAEARQPPLSPTNPMFFGIVDARHAVDERYWMHVLPPFFFADDHAVVSFQHDIALAQLAHHCTRQRRRQQRCPRPSHTPHPPTHPPPHTHPHTPPIQL